MNEFDEICAVRRIQQLYAERYVEVTHAEIRRRAGDIRRYHGMDIVDAYECIEDQLLSTPPKPERWD